MRENQTSNFNAKAQINAKDKKISFDFVLNLNHVYIYSHEIFTNHLAINCIANLKITIKRL